MLEKCWPNFMSIDPKGGGVYPKNEHIWVTLWSSIESKNMFQMNKMEMSTKPTTKSNVWEETFSKVLGHEAVHERVDAAETNKRKKLKGYP